MKCPLCGYEFEESLEGMCRACPMRRGCRAEICCPNCGYTVPESSSLVEFIKRMVKKVGGKV